MSKSTRISHQLSQQTYSGLCGLSISRQASGQTYSVFTSLFTCDFSGSSLTSCVGGLSFSRPSGWMRSPLRSYFLRMSVMVEKLMLYFLTSRDILTCSTQQSLAIQFLIQSLGSYVTSSLILRQEARFLMSLGVKSSSRAYLCSFLIAPLYCILKQYNNRAASRPSPVSERNIAPCPAFATAVVLPRPIKDLLPRHFSHICFYFLMPALYRLPRQPKTRCIRAYTLKAKLMLRGAGRWARLDAVGAASQQLYSKGYRPIMGCRYPSSFTANQGRNTSRAAQYLTDQCIGRIIGNAELRVPQQPNSAGAVQAAGVLRALRRSTLRREKEKMEMGRSVFIYFANASHRYYMLGMVKQKPSNMITVNHGKQLLSISERAVPSTKRSPPLLACQTQPGAAESSRLPGLPSAVSEQLAVLLVIFSTPTRNIQYSMQLTRRSKQSASKAKLLASSESKRTFKKLPQCAPPLPELKQELKNAIKNIQSLNDGALDDAYQNKDLHGALRVLHQLEAAISDCPYENSKRLYYLNLSVFYNNKAFILGELEHDEECCKMMERSLRQYELVFGCPMSREEQIAHGAAFLKLSLRYCALLSHAERHQQAIAVSEKCLLKVSELLLLLGSLCSQSMETARDTPDTIATESDSRMKSAEKVNFKRIVVKEARKMLAEIEELPLPQQLMQQQKEQYEQKIKNMYFWKNNADNNARNMRKELHSNDKGERNLLGLQKSSSFLEEFSLSDLMSLDLLKMRAKTNADTFYLLSAPKIIELVLFAAVCYFTIATETRFSQGNLDVTTLKISEKYKKLHADETISKCKVLHLKAVELAGKYLPADNDFFAHLINSFNKNYKCIMDEIKEESEISLKDINNDINETYYHRLDETSKFEEHTLTSAKKKKRSVSKEREKVVGLKRKVRANSISKK